MDIKTNVVENILYTFLGLSGVYIIFLFFKPKLKACCFGTNHRFRPWSPCVFYTRDWLYNHIIRNPICFVTIVISCWAISILNLRPNPFISMNGSTIANYTFENNTLTPFFEKVTKYDKNKNQFHSIDLHGFENLVNVLLPLFFAVALQKYMTTRNEFLAFCGEVEFMAIYFMTLTNNESSISGKLESQLKRIKTILCMMPTTVYELEKNRDLKPEDLYYDHSNSYDGNRNRAFTIQIIDVTKLSSDKNRINKSIYRDIKKLRKTGLGLFECLLHLLIGYIDKIKQEKSAYNTSIERDFIVKWNHINAGWGNIDNSSTYKTPILLDVMFRLSLCVYAFFKPRTILFTCENDVCGNIVWASFGAVFPYLILFVFSDILQDPFQDYKINPTVTKVAFDTQHNVKKLFNLQLGICETEECEKHHFSYDDGYDGYEGETYNKLIKKKMTLLKKCVPLNVDGLVTLLEQNETLFNRCSLYRKQDTLNWKELYDMMTKSNLWSENDQVITYQNKEVNTKDNLTKYLKYQLGWRIYDQIMFSIYASNNVRIHIQQIIFSGYEYEKVTRRVTNYLENLDGTSNIDTCDKNIIWNENDEIDTKGQKLRLKNCNNEKDAIDNKNGEYVFDLKETWYDIVKNINGDVYEFSSFDRVASRSFQIDIFKNKNRDGHLKFV